MEEGEIKMFCSMALSSYLITMMGEDVSELEH